MLGINSSISIVSVHSKKKSLKSKASPSTLPESPQLSPAYSTQFPNSDEYWTSECPNRKAKDLECKVVRMQKNQLQMEAKFQKCIEQMLGEIERNNQSNGLLTVEVNKLQTQVSQSKKDILIIEEYLKVKEGKRNPRVEHRDLGRPFSSRDLMGSMSRSKNILVRRQSSKLFKSKLFPRQ